MNLYVITGTSRGIGNALARLLLEDPNNTVIGISRSTSISHNRYSHLTLDLSDTDNLQAIQLPELSSLEQAVLINNSGELGEVKPFAEIEASSLARTFAVNTIAPAILSNLFIKHYSSIAKEIIIANISSGAGRHPIKSWAAYCASKAALDMLSLVISEEEKAKPASNIRVLSIAPGIVDTTMQESIRTLSRDSFPDIDRFVAYKEKGSLSDPLFVASKILSIIKNPEITDTILDVRTI